MRGIRTFLCRLSGLFDVPRKDRELSEELESHLQMHIEDNIRSGMTPEQARRDALIKSGGLELAKEKYRDRRSLPLLETVTRDLRHAMMVIVGVYGVISCWVAQRTREVGIRMALGADRRRIARMVVGRGLLISVLGILIGLGGSLALSEVVGSMLYGISPTNPVAIVGVAFLLLLIALLGSVLPALRAASVDPARILRAG